MKWTTEKIEELRRRYPHEDNGRLARDFGCSRKALVFRASHLGIRKTAQANEARYAAMTRRIAPESMEGARHEIATGIVVVRGNVLTHFSNCSASREQARTTVEDDGQEWTAQEWDAPHGEDHPPARQGTRQITCPHCKAQFLVLASAGSQTASSMEA